MQHLYKNLRFSSIRASEIGEKCIWLVRLLSDCLLQVATEKDNGILLYKDDHDPLALELYQGHIRLIYDFANYPPTTVYR